VRLLHPPLSTWNVWDSSAVALHRFHVTLLSGTMLHTLFTSPFLASTRDKSTDKWVDRSKFLNAHSKSSAIFAQCSKVADFFRDCGPLEIDLVYEIRKKSPSLIGRQMSWYLSRINSDAILEIFSHESFDSTSLAQSAREKSIMSARRWRALSRCKSVISAI